MGKGARTPILKWLFFIIILVYAASWSGMVSARLTGFSGLSMISTILPDVSPSPKSYPLINYVSMNPYKVPACGSTGIWRGVCSQGHRWPKVALRPHQGGILTAIIVGNLMFS